MFHILTELVRFDEIRTPKIGNDGRQGTFYFYFPVSNGRHDKEFFVDEEKKRSRDNQIKRVI